MSYLHRLSEVSSVALGVALGKTYKMFHSNAVHRPSDLQVGP